MNKLKCISASEKRETRIDIEVELDTEAWLKFASIIKTGGHKLPPLIIIRSKS